MVVKTKRINDTVIVVLDERILNRDLGGDETLYEEIMSLSNYLKESHNDDDFMRAKADLIKLMLPKKESPQLELSFSSNHEEKTELKASKDFEKAKKIADISGKFEYDGEGRVYMKGYSMPIPVKLADAILDSHYNPESKYSTEALINFWQWVILNPNKQARIDLFDWFDTGEFVITEQGLIVAYRNVDVKSKGISSKLENFVNESYIKVKKNKQSPKKYAVVKEGGEYKCKFLKRYPDAVNKKGYKGLLSELYADTNTLEGCTVYTDNYTGKMNIKIGEEVSMPRQECDENHNAQCSSGLHFMSPAYSLRLGATTIVILVNPYNIVAFPNYDNTKGRCCAYLPIGMAEKDENNNIVTIESGTYDFDYSKYTSEILDKMIKGSNFEELVENKIIASDLTSGDFELVKSKVQDIIENRIIDVI